MQITLKATRSRVLVVMLVTSALTTSAVALDTLQAKGDTFTVGSQIIKPAQYRGRLQALIKHSELFVLPNALDGERYLVLVRRPTRPLSMHRCGAGFEDYLAMVRYHGGGLYLLDKITLQSCENSIDLAQPDASQPDQIISALKLDGDSLSFSVVTSTNSGDVSTPKEQRFLLTSDHFVKK